MKRYLYSLVKAAYGGKEVDLERVLNDIKPTLEFLHSLDLVHVSTHIPLGILLKLTGIPQNDVNPANIMIDETGHGILIDFGECKPEGYETLNHTYGFSLEGDDIARRERFKITRAYGEVVRGCHGGTSSECIG